MGTPTEGTHPPCSAHTKGAHPYGPPETPSPLGTTTHTLPACPQLGRLWHHEPVTGSQILNSCPTVSQALLPAVRVRVPVEWDRGAREAETKALHRLPPPPPCAWRGGRTLGSEKVPKAKVLNALLPCCCHLAARGV